MANRHRRAVALWLDMCAARQSDEIFRIGHELCHACVEIKSTYPSQRIQDDVAVRLMSAMIYALTDHIPVLDEGRRLYERCKEIVEREEREERGSR